eukprot:CAMPEP_0177629258 /NCGR_PEP_ID=MMETSP0447-20121125/572_1 /TAXON_ID=0 /ORGANISM="Stygamoeba regulata, Strain BSH-02190019" /LENGTH=68 /DNA_ID=CAMNT_0019130567 /DNA_START=68 /DNA_END=274 /DNA_ORIENTATION=-
MDRFIDSLKATPPSDYHRELYQKVRVRNAAVGLSLAAAVAGVYFYSMRAVSQDDFSDVDERGNLVSKK